MTETTPPPIVFGGVANCANVDCQGPVSYDERYEYPGVCPYCGQRMHLVRDSDGVGHWELPKHDSEAVLLEMLHELEQGRANSTGS